MNIFFTLKKQLQKKQILYLSILIFLMIFISIFEMIGLGSVPILLGSILKQNYLVESTNIEFLKNFFNETSQKNQIIYLSIFIVTFFLFKNVYQAFVVYVQGQITKGIKIYFSRKLFNFYVNQDYLFLIKKNSSIIIRTISTDIANTTRYILSLLNLSREMLILIAIFSLLLISNPQITLFIFSVFLTIVSLFYFFNKKNILFRGKIIQKLTSDMIKVIYETIGMFKELKIYNIGKYQKDLFFKKINISEINVFKNYFIQSLPKLFLELAAIFLIVTIILFYVVNDKNIFDLLPFLSLLVVVSLRLIPIFNGIATSLGSMRSTKPSFNLVMSELSDSDKYLEKYKEINYLEFNDEIKLDNISFKYSEDDKLIINNLSLKIKKGDKIGIIGESGSGKTTLINLIMGLFKITNGNIFVDGNQLSNKKYNIIKNIGYVPQEINLVENTIGKNIAIGLNDNEISLTKLKEASSSAQILDFILKLDEKFDTKVEEKGNNFSVGQKQRIGVARALYRSPNLLILDESTSSLDSKTEQNFINDIFEFNKEKTIIFISHRASSLSKCNKIFDIKKNKFI